MASPLQQLRERLSWRRMVAVGGVLGVLYVGVTFFQVLLAAGTDDRVEADAIVVLGAAQYDGEPSPVLAGRLDHAEKLWREGVAPIVVTTGSNLPGDRFTEGFAGYEYLRVAGIPDADLLVITDGASTWEQLAATARSFVCATSIRSCWCRSVPLASAHPDRRRGRARGLGFVD